MTKEKRPFGRPKKNLAPEPPKNPDREPATKAYVKCLLRKVLPHSHKQDIKFSASGIGAFAMWLVTAFTTIGLGTTGGSPLRSKQQKARDFSHGMNASSYQQTRGIISMASV